MATAIPLPPHSGCLAGYGKTFMCVHRKNYVLDLNHLEHNIRPNITSQKTHNVFITETNLCTKVPEIIGLSHENHPRHACQ